MDENAPQELHASTKMHRYVLLRLAPGDYWQARHVDFVRLWMPIENTLSINKLINRLCVQVLMICEEINRI